MTTTPSLPLSAEQLDKLQAIADRVDARGLFNASCDIREWIAQARTAQQAMVDTQVDTTASRGESAKELDRRYSEGYEDGWREARAPHGAQAESDDLPKLDKAWAADLLCINEAPDDLGAFNEARVRAALIGARAALANRSSSAKADDQPST